MNFNFSNNLDISLIYAAEHLIDKNFNNNMYLDKSHKTDSKINAYNYNYNKVIKFLEELEVCRPNEDSKLEVFLEKEFQKLSIKQYLLLKYILKYLPDWHIRFISPLRPNLHNDEDFTAYSTTSTNPSTLTSGSVARVD